MRTVAVAGLGPVGFKVAAALDRGIDGLVLAAVSAADRDRAAGRVERFQRPPPVLPADALAEAADVVVECLPPAVFFQVARPAISRGRVLVVASAGALIATDGLAADAAQTGARIIVPSGAIAGLDGLRAASEAGLEEVRLTTRKPPRSFGAEVTVGGRNVATQGIAEPLLLFSGSAREAIRRFPVNVNVAAAVSLAGLGPDRTEVEVWADPAARRNEHRLDILSSASEFTATSVNLPDPDNPKTSAITGHAMVAALRRLVAPLVVGT